MFKKRFWEQIVKLCPYKQQKAPSQQPSAHVGYLVCILLLLLYQLFLSLLQCSADNSLVHTPTSLLKMPVGCCDQVLLKHASSIHFLHILPSLKPENTEVITHKM